MLRRTKEGLRAVPRKGLGYGLLRHLTDWTPAKGSGAEVSFNYLGQSGRRPDAVDTGEGRNDHRFRPSGRDLGASQSSEGERPHLLEVNSQVVDGRLEMVWTYGGGVHDGATIERLAHRYVDVLAEVIEFCCRAGVGGCTPSDFPLAGLDQVALDGVAGRFGTVLEDVYPLTALQQGMVFHSQLSSDAGMYWVQNGLLLEGELDVGALRRAWELVFARHEVLRSGVVWEGVPQPLAVVSRSVSLPWEVVDFSLVGEGVRGRVDDFLAADWARGADFSAPTLVRLALVRLAVDRYQLVWSYHHLLLDGWSVPIVLGEVLEAYHAFRVGGVPRLGVR
ncbi:condensation domain-containing protein, partial [Streptomyces sp. NPDC087844]|uniref:condensation domain-containing protein n=1 Tax=Streptomyces sp. NPDC087844 TaxID=3365805 RepID=UPI0037F4A6CF